MKQKILLWACVLCLAGCFHEDVPEANERVGVGDPLPAMELVMHDGSVVRNADFPGKVVVMVFFSVKCGDCRKELPEVERFYASLPEDSGVMVLAVSRAEGVSLVTPFWEELSLTLPYSAQEDDKVYRLFADSVVPRIYIADSNGIVVATFDDSNMPSAEQLGEVVSRIAVTSQRDCLRGFGLPPI